MVRDVEQQQQAAARPTLTQRVVSRLYVLLFRRDFDFIEVLSGLLMLGWGAQLLLPWETFSTSPAYAAMAALMPEPVWGGLLTWIGFTQVGAYLLDHWRVRLASALGASMAWTFLGVAFGYANLTGTGVVVYPWLALVTAWVFWRILQAGPADD